MNIDVPFLRLRWPGSEPEAPVSEEIHQAAPPEREMQQPEPHFEPPAALQPDPVLSSEPHADAALEPEPDTVPESVPKPEHLSEPDPKQSSRPDDGLDAEPAALANPVLKDCVPATTPFIEEPLAALETRLPEPIRARQRRGARFVELPVRRATWGDYAARVRRHGIMVLFATVTGFAVGALASFASPHSYIAMAILIGPKPDAALLRTELAVLHSDEVASAVVDKVGVSRLIASGRPSRVFAPLSFIRPDTPAPSERSHALAIVSAGFRESDSGSANGTRSPDSLHFTISSSDPGLAIDLLDATISSEKHARSKINALTQSAAIGLQLVTAQRELENIQSESANLRAEASVSDISQETAVTAAQANTIAGRQGELELRQSAVLAEVGKARELLQTTPAKVFDSQENNRREAGDEARSLLLRLQLERSHLIEQYAPGYAGIAEIDRKIKVAEMHTHDQQIPAGSISREVRNPAYETLLLRLAALEPEVDGLVAQRLEAQRQAGQNASRAKELRDVSTRLGALRRRSEASETIIRDLAQNMSRVKLQETSFAAQLDGLRWLAQSPVQKVSTPHAGAFMPFGALAGLLCGVTLSCLRGRHGPRYAVAEDAERHLALPQLANLRLWRKGVAQPLQPGAMRNLIQVITQAICVQDSPMTVIHLMATDAHAGADRIARALANTWLADKDASVLVIYLGENEFGKIESFRPDSLIDEASDQSLLESRPRDASMVVGAPDLIQAVLANAYPNTEALRLQVDHLRALHDVLLIVTEYDHDSALIARIASDADLSVLILRAGHSRRRQANKLCNVLGQNNLRPLGLVFAA